MGQVVHMDVHGRAREEASSVHARAMVERHRHELEAIYRNRKARLATMRRARYAWLVAVGVLGLATGSFLTSAWRHPYPDAWASGSMETVAASQPALPPHEPVPVPVMPAATPIPHKTVTPSRMESSQALAAPSAKATIPPGQPPEIIEIAKPTQASPMQQRGGVYEAPSNQSALKSSVEKRSFQLVSVPTEGVALIQQGATIKPIRIGERLPDGSVLKSAASDATGIETSNGKMSIETKLGQ